MKQIAVLYICTGKYEIFWDDFHSSSEKHFCPGVKKHYFVFTDSTRIQEEPGVTVLHQDNLGWPMIACYRYRILLRIEEKLRDFNGMAFFNANALFVKDIQVPEFFGNNPEGLVCALHPLFPKADSIKAPFESRTSSTAYVSESNRIQYCQSAISAGHTNAYLRMLRELKKNTEDDLQQGIVALWHDESHWNAYINNDESRSRSLHVLDQSYMYPESYDLPFKPKIMMRDKHKHGGHNFLRGQTSQPPARGLKGLIRKSLGKLR